ncbi:MAG: acyl-CoA thioesterase [Solirubrobacterales bacterium]
MDQGFSHQLRVRYAECDAQGIVFNANWFAFYDVVMTEFWREALGGYQHLPEKFGVETVVAETGARFRGAGRFDDELDFAVQIARVGASSMRAEIDATRDGELLVEGFIEYVFVDRQTLQPVPIPELVRNQLPAPAAA